MKTFPFEMIGVDAALPGISMDHLMFSLWLNLVGIFLASLDPSMLGPRQLDQSALLIIFRKTTKLIRINVKDCIG